MRVRLLGSNSDENQRAKILLFCFLIFGGLANAQNNIQTASTKDPQAVAAITSALTAMGGATAFAAIQDTTVSGQSQSTNPSAPADQFVCKNMGMTLRHEYSMTDGLHVSVINSGKGQRQEPSGQIVAIDPRASLTIQPFHMPGTLLLQQLTSPNVSLGFISDPADDGTLIHISSMQQLPHIKLNPVTRQDWFFDSATGLPVKVRFVLPDLRNQRLDGTATIVFTAWQTASSIQVPRITQLFYDDVLQETDTFSVPAFNQGLSASIFQLQ